MARCNQCVPCQRVIEFRVKQKGKARNRKNLKKFENCNKCTNPIPSSKKRKYTEVELLSAGGHGGETRRELRTDENVHLSSRNGRTTRPSGSLKEEDWFDEEAYTEYERIVLQCGETAKTSDSEAVKTEAPSMLAKMRRLLEPSIRTEVDYKEATVDLSNVLASWMMGKAAGTKAFIPDTRDRDEIYAALQIFSCAGEEAKQIQVEYVEHFGDDGYHMHHLLVGMIGEVDKRCLPYVNMCLRSWLPKLVNDMELWSDWSSLDFDSWVAEEISRAKENGHRGKTSYELMMAFFGDKSSIHSSVEGMSFEY